MARSLREPGSHPSDQTPSGSGGKAVSIPRASRLRSLSEAATPGLLRECGHDRADGPCSCGMIWSLEEGAPLATVTVGDWGDDYPSLRFVDGGEGSINPRVEAYMERMIYGHVPAEVAKSNASFLAALWNAYRSGELVERTPQGIEARSAETSGSAEGESPSALGGAPDLPSQIPQAQKQEKVA